MHRVCQYTACGSTLRVSVYCVWQYTAPYGAVVHSQGGTPVSMYAYDTPVTRNGATRILDEYLAQAPDDDPAPYEFPDGVTVSAALFAEFVTTWRALEAESKVDALGGAQCCSSLWRVAHGTMAIDWITVEAGGAP